MTYDKRFLENQACEALASNNNIVNTRDLCVYIQCSTSTYYYLKLHKSKKIRTALLKNVLSCKSVKKRRARRRKAVVPPSFTSRLISLIASLFSSGKKNTKRNACSEECSEPSETKLKLKCSQCKKMISIDLFWKTKTGRGYSYYCKECTKKKDRKRNAEKSKANKRKKAYADLPWPTAPKYKVCRDCNKTLPASLFNRHKVSKDGLQPSCKSCTKERYAKKKAK